MSADPENEYFSDGLSEELMNVLAKNPGLKVTGRTSAFAFKGRNEDLREIGQKLGVATLLEGSVRKAGNRVRITTQLIKVADGFHLWSETYDRVLDDIFAVQDDIARAVAAALHVTLLGKPATPTAKVNAESYNLVLQANHLTSLNTVASATRAVELYRQAIAIDPDDARAWAGLARVHAVQAGWGLGDHDEAAARCREAASRALALDDGLAEAHEMMGWILQFLDYDNKGSKKAFRKAAALAPGAPRMIMSMATLEAMFRRFEEALKLGRRALELDPLSAYMHMLFGRLHMLAGHHDEARDSYRRALELSPGLAPAQAVIGLTHLFQGRAADGLEEARKETSVGYRNWALACIHHSMGDRAASDLALDTLIRQGSSWSFQVANVHAWRGENDPAFEWLERAYATHDAGVPLTLAHPMLANIQDDPRMPPFLKKIGLAP